MNRRLEQFLDQLKYDHAQRAIFGNVFDDRENVLDNGSKSGYDKVYDPNDVLDSQDMMVKSNKGGTNDE
jgi:hypothetical protein